MSIYILRLQQGKYWVGYTTEPICSIKIFRGLNDWISAYKPESIYKIIPAKAYRLDYEVKELMADAGIDNVRGGTWSDSVLPATVIRSLTTEIIGNPDKICFMCQKQGHYVQDCPEDDSGDSISEFFSSTTEPSPALRPFTPYPSSIPTLTIN
jgi:hypothetical protein